VSIDRALGALEQVVLGKPRQVRLALACLLARGHLLIEDVPGVGKTTLAHALAQVLGLSWQRVQFTSDMLPADILGVAVFDRATQRFEYRRGPIFTQLLLADEVNRASPRTQSALLEAMEERQVSIDGVSHELPAPFFVVATQNPREQLGTYPLPESQLDRFLMRIELGYPDRQQERVLLAESGQQRRGMNLQGALVAGEVLALQQQSAAVHVSAAVLDYVQSLVAASRADSGIRLGLSPRAAQGLVQAARAWSLVRGAEFVTHDDVQAIWGAVAGHRLDSTQRAAFGSDLARGVLESVPVPD
jgi:MoxR-like ATPase